MRRIFFDLDGTLTDSSQGIFNSILYAVHKLGYREPTQAELRGFVGPPLLDTFKQTYELTDEEGQKAVEAYRENYRVSGINEFQVYDGMEATLQELSQNFELYVATSKPEEFATQVLQTAGLADYFDKIFGADMAGIRSEKSQVIRYGLDQLESIESAEMVMVGDRAQDILGAKANSLQSIGVLYGFGDREELENAGADWIVERPEDIIGVVK